MNNNTGAKQIIPLTPEEGVRMSRDRLSDLYGQFGDTSAEDIISRAVEALALRMSACRRLYQAGQRREMRRNLRSQITISEQIGMMSLADAARNVVDCLDRDDAVALSATLARLTRIGDQSMSALWDLEDLSV